MLLDSKKQFYVVFFSETVKRSGRNPGSLQKAGGRSLGLKGLATHSSQYLLGSKIPADTDRTQCNSVVARRSTAFHLAYLSKFVSETFVTG